MKYRYTFVLIFLLICTFFTAPVTANSSEVGVWDGVSHDEEFEFNPENGVTKKQFEKVVKRSMARVEVLRDRPFKQTVPVEIFTRSRFKISDKIVYNEKYSESQKSYLNEYWNSLFIVEQGTSAVKAQRQVTVENVKGYYNPENERIVFVAENNSEGRYYIEEKLLIQELTHAMQDQYTGLWEDKLRYKTKDEQLSKSMFVEGEASVIVNSFDAKCKSDWTCIQGKGTVSRFSERNEGILYSLYIPYAVGERYIYQQPGNSLNEKIEAGYENVPSQTRQYLVDDLKIKEPVELYLKDTSNSNWSIYSSTNWQGRDSIGQSVLYTMLWYQKSQYGLDINIRDIDDPTKPNETHNYRSKLTKPLITDSLAVYQKDKNVEKAGYVWKTIWRDKNSATKFRDVYVDMLKLHGGSKQDLSKLYNDQTMNYIEVETNSAELYVIKDGGFSGKYVIFQDENTLLVLNADSKKGLKSLRNISDEPTFIKDHSLETIAEKNDTEVEEEETGIINYIKSKGVSISLVLLMIIFMGGMYYKDVTPNRNKKGDKKIK